MMRTVVFQFLLLQLLKSSEITVLGRLQAQVAPDDSHFQQNAETENVGNSQKLREEEENSRELLLNFFVRRHFSGSTWDGWGSGSGADSSSGGGGSGEENGSGSGSSSMVAAPTPAPTFPVCEVCGPDKVVGSPNTTVTIPPGEGGDPPGFSINCDDLEQDGLNGRIEPDECENSSDFAMINCNCIDEI